MVAGACTGSESNGAGGGSGTGGSAGTGGVGGAGGNELEARVAELVAQMTLEEKVAQMAGDGFFGEPVLLWNVPGVERLGVPPFRMLDGPRGAVFEGATTFPVGASRAATWDPDVERRVGEAMGAELRAVGGNILLAPTINIVRHPRWGRSQEAYGEDVHLMGRMAVAFSQGVQQHVLANPKHYAVNSIEDTRFEVDMTFDDERTLREIYLPHFRAAVIEGGAASVMTAYNKVNGQYCGENEQLIRDILKGDWAYDGFTLSDWIFGTQSTVDATLNGLDIEMPTPRFRGDALLDAVNGGEVPESVIDDAVTRTVRKKLEFGLDELSTVDESVIASEEHLALAREAGAEGSVLLKNEAGALPLDTGELTSIVVIGELAALPNTGDSGSSSTRPAFVVTAIEGIEDAVGDAVVVDHIDSDVVQAEDEAVIAAADAVIVVTGLTSEDEGEGAIAGGDRDSLALSAERNALISDVAALNDRTVVVLEGGSAILVEGWVESIEALLMAWYPGQLGGNAIADVLFGAVNPSGKLPVTFPVDEAQLPPFDNTSLEVTYDYFHGYRHVDREGLTPRFPFGYGLSYTTFSVDNLSVDNTQIDDEDVVRLTVDVTNTGDAAGSEVVQAYVSYPGSAVVRADRDLKGFAKVSVAPGATESVEIKIRVGDLAYYDTPNAQWVTEALDYEVHVGTSSRDLPLSETFSVD